MIRKWFWGAVWTLILTAVLQGQSRESLLRAVTQAPNWTPADQPTEYDEKNIEALAGKRGAAINRYGLIGATTQSWSGPEGKVRLTLYEMLDASAAYGLFTIERNIDQPGFSEFPVGSEGFRVSNRFCFWQSKYVVKLERDAPAAETLARIISQNIFGRSQKPPVTNLLPPENLVQGTEKYVIDPLGIGSQLDLNPDSLGFDDDVEIATASYRIDGKPANLVLLLYPTQQVAKKYADRWEADAPNDAAFRKRVGPLFALVRGSRDPAVAGAILDQVNHEPKVTWNEPLPDLSLRDVILTIFTFIGIALVFTFVAGLSFGGLRVFLKARYPGRVFDRSADVEIIQLKLNQGVIRKELGK